MYMGSSPTAASGVKEAETMVGRKFKYHRSFDSSDLPGTFQQSSCSNDATNGWRSGYSFVCTDDTRAGQISSGLYDTRFANWIKSVPLGHKVDFGFAHELDAKLAPPTSLTLAGITAAYQRARSVWDQLKADGVPQVVSGDVLLCHCILIGNWSAAGNYSASTGLVTPQPTSVSEQNKFNDIFAASHIFALDIYGGGLGPGRRWNPRFDPFINWWENGNSVDGPGKGLSDGRMGVWETSANDQNGALQTDGIDGITLKHEWIDQSIKGIYNISGGEFYSAFYSSNGSQPYFNRQEYADQFRDLFDVYGGTATTPPPEPPPPLPEGAYNPQGGRAFFEQWPNA